MKNLLRTGDIHDIQTGPELCSEAFHLTWFCTQTRCFPETGETHQKKNVREPIKSEYHKFEASVTLNWQNARPNQFRAKTRPIWISPKWFQNTTNFITTRKACFDISHGKRKSGKRKTKFAAHLGRQLLAQQFLSARRFVDFRKSPRQKYWFDLNVDILLSPQVAANLQVSIGDEIQLAPVQIQGTAKSIQIQSQTKTRLAENQITDLEQVLCMFGDF